MLVLNSLACITYNIPFEKFPSASIYAWISLSFVDMLTQLLICYICVTLGARDSLNRFDCYMVDDGQGGFIMRFVAKHPVPEAIGVPYAAERSGDESFSLSSRESVDNEFTRNEPLWRDRRRGDSINY
jgi:hypothetical protein